MSKSDLFKAVLENSLQVIKSNAQGADVADVNVKGKDSSSALMKALEGLI